MTEFFIHTWEGKLKPVEGEAVVIPGFEQVEFFVYRDTWGWTVTEVSTGHRISRLPYTEKQDAITAAKVRLEEKGLVYVRRRIKKVLATRKKETDVHQSQATA